MTATMSISHLSNFYDGNVVTLTSTCDGPLCSSSDCAGTIGLLACKRPGLDPWLRLSSRACVHPVLGPEAESIAMAWRRAQAYEILANYLGEMRAATWLSKASMAARFSSKYW